LKRTKLVYAVSITSLMLMLVFATPHVFADDETPVTPTVNVRFPGYHVSKTTGSPPLPAAVARIGTAKGSPGPLTKGFPRAVCSIPSPGMPGGIATGPGGQFIEDWNTGNLWFYNTATKKCTLIQKPPKGATAKGYWGLAVTGSLVALISFGAEGLWTCTYSSGVCTTVSSFIPLRSKFCASMPAGYCNPDGLAFDKKTNLWYVDVVNSVEVEVTAASDYSAVGKINYYGPGYIPSAPSGLIGIAIDGKGNHWVVDFTCSGNLYENRGLVSSNGDDVEGIAISKNNPYHAAHIYVTVTNFCGNYPGPFVGDMNDFKILPSPYSSGSDEMPGISTVLYFTDIDNDQVWLTKDTL